MPSTAQRSSVTALAVLLLFSQGCNRHQAQEPAASAVLRIAFVPQRDQEERYQNAYHTLGYYLERTLGQGVEVTELPDANTALEGMRAGKLDFCSFSPWPAMLAEEKAGAEPLVITAGIDGLPAGYHTVFITHPQSNVRSIDEMKARSHELVFSFEEPVSTSGHLVPRAYLRAVGIDPEHDFKQLLFSPDSTVSILSVKAGRIDVATVSNTSLRRALQMKRVAPDEIIVLHETPPVVSNVICVRRVLPEALKSRLRDALIALPSRSPVEWAEVARMYSNPVHGYLGATDELLEPCREMIRNTPGLSLTL